MALLRIPRYEVIGGKTIQISDSEFYGDEERVWRKNAYYSARKKGIPHAQAFDYCNSLTESDFLRLCPVLDIDPRWCYVVGAPDDRSDIRFGQIAFVKLEHSMKYQGLHRAFVGTEVSTDILVGPDGGVVEVGVGDDIFVADACDVYGVLIEPEGGSGDMQFQPIWDFVLVKEDERKTETEGGIAIPDTVDIPTIEGEVVATGPSVVCGYQTLDMPVKVGDRVVYAEHSAQKITIDGAVFSVVRAPSIYGVLSSATEINE